MTCRSTSPWRVASLALIVSLCGCSDGATRVAFQIESAANAFQHSSATSYVIRHVPEFRPEGCAGAYTIQFSANSSLLIWCKAAVGGKVTSSHTTTYHLRFVKVPRTYIVDKAAGEPTFIELDKVGGAVVVSNVR